MDFNIQDFQRLLDADRLSAVATFSTHPLPGLFFSDPQEGETFYLDDQQRSLALNRSEIEEEADQVELLGVINSEEILPEILSNWITERDHEVSLAVQQHFLDNQSTDGDWWNSLPIFYWCETSTIYSQTLKAVD